MASPTIDRTYFTTLRQYPETGMNTILIPRDVARSMETLQAGLSVITGFHKNYSLVYCNNESYKKSNLIERCFVSSARNSDLFSFREIASDGKLQMIGVVYCSTIQEATVLRKNCNFDFVQTRR